jgi:hypothetical protein
LTGGRAEGARLLLIACLFAAAKSPPSSRSMSCRSWMGKPGATAISCATSFLVLKSEMLFRSKLAPSRSSRLLLDKLGLVNGCVRRRATGIAALCEVEKFSSAPGLFLVRRNEGVSTCDVLCASLFAFGQYSVNAS